MVFNDSTQVNASFFFFFSSRRRHTRSLRDWSSDVCSSDLDLEFYATLRTERAIERANVCVLVVDATVGLHNQDLRIATQAWDQGAALIVVVNKWDLVEEKDANTARRGQDALIEKAPFLRYVP